VDLSLLAELGGAAGVAGIAIGRIALARNQFLKSASALARFAAALTLRFVAIGAFAIGTLGIVAWLIAGVQLGTGVKTSDYGIATSGNATGNAVICGSPPLAPAMKS
jgi:hypothetical protein